MKILKNIENKRGDTLILSIVIITIVMMFTILIVDFGIAFSTKAQLQTISDAMAIGGVNYGQKGLKSAATGKKAAIVDEKLAPKKANDIFNANKGYLPERTEISSKVYNPSGKKINGVSMNRVKQYYSGNFSVVLKGYRKTLFHGGTIGGLDKISLKTESGTRTQAK